MRLPPREGCSQALPAVGDPGVPSPPPEVDVRDSRWNRRLAQRPIRSLHVRFRVAHVMQRVSVVADVMFMPKLTRHETECYTERQKL